MKIACLAGLLCLFLPLSANSQELPDINSLISEVVRKAVQNDKVKQERVVYTEDYVFEEFNYKGELKKTNNSSTVISGRARKLAGFDLEIGGLLQLLVARHNFSEPKRTVLKNKQALVIDFKPKPNLITKTTEDKFLNRLNGSLTVDAGDYSLLEVDARINESDSFSFRAWWTIIFVTVDVRSFAMKFEQIQFSGVTVENKIEVETTFRVIGGTRTRKYHYQYKDYKYK